MLVDKKSFDDEIRNHFYGRQGINSINVEENFLRMLDPGLAVSSGREKIRATSGADTNRQATNVSCDKGSVTDYVDSQVSRSIVSESSSTVNHEQFLRYEQEIDSLRKELEKYREQVTTAEKKVELTTKMYDRIKKSDRRYRSLMAAALKDHMKELKEIDEGFAPEKKSASSETPEQNVEIIWAREMRFTVPEEVAYTIKYGKGPIATETYLRYAAKAWDLDLDNKCYTVHGARGKVVTTHQVLSKDITNSIVHWVIKNVEAAEELDSDYKETKTNLQKSSKNWKKMLKKVRNVKNLVGEAFQNINAKKDGRWKNRLEQKKQKRKQKGKQKLIEQEDQSEEFDGEEDEAEEEQVDDYNDEVTIVKIQPSSVKTRHPITDCCNKCKTQERVIVCDYCSSGTCFPCSKNCCMCRILLCAGCSIPRKVERNIGIYCEQCQADL